MISDTSRYASDTITTVSDDRGVHLSVNHPAPEESVINFTSYMTKENDTLDWLAYSIFGAGNLWWIIADANPEILDWTSVTPGTIIRIPYSG